MNTEILYKPIGFIETQFETIDGVPIQPSGAANTQGIITLCDDYIEGLTDLDGFSHLILLYHFHLVKAPKLSVIPFMDDKPHGIFATRSPARPNPIGISIVRLKKIVGRQIFFDGADMLNKTPLIDIKPFFPKFDNRADAKAGWLENKTNIEISSIKSDNRFV